MKCYKVQKYIVCKAWCGNRKQVCGLVLENVILVFDLLVSVVYKIVRELV